MLNRVEELALKECKHSAATSETNALESGFKTQQTKSCDVATCMEKRVQPWMAHWPAKKAAPADGIQYSFVKGQKVVIRSS